MIYLLFPESRYLYIVFVTLTNFVQNRVCPVLTAFYLIILDLVSVALCESDDKPDDSWIHF